jgi:7tm Chemosensory receptor
MLRFLLIDNAENILRLLKVFGVAPFTVVKNKSTTRLIDVLSSLTTILASGIILVSSIIYSENLKTGKSDLCDFGAKVSIIGGVSVVLIATSVTFLYRHRVWSIIVNLRAVDKIFKNFMFAGGNQKFINIYSILMMSYITLAPILSFFIYKSHKSGLSVVMYLYAGFYYCLLNQMTAVFITSIYVRLCSMNKVLEMCLSPRTNQRFKVGNTEVFKSMTKVYELIVNISGDVNAVYGRLVMSGMSLVFFFLIFTLFMTYKDIAKGTLDAITITSISFALYMVIFTSTTVGSFIWVEVEARESLKICRKLMRETKESRENSTLISLSSSILRRSLKFSSGLFDFDLHLAYRVR